MTLQDFAAAVTALQIPAVYGYYGDEQPPPYIAYRATEKNVLYADGRAVYWEDWMTLEFVSKNRDLAAEKQIETMLTANGIAFGTPELYFDEKQRVHIAVYQFMLD